MSAHTCIACRVVFATSEFQRAHYKSDWHRYNLKRKVAELPPVTAETFKQKVLAQRSQQEAATEKDASYHCKVCNKHFGNANTFENHNSSRKHQEMVLRESRRSDVVVTQKNRLNREKAASQPLVTEKEMPEQENKKGAEVKHQPLAGSADGGQDVLDDDDDDWEDIDDDIAVGSGDESPWEGEGLTPDTCLFCPHRSDNMQENLNHMSQKHSFFLPDVEYIQDLEGLLIYLGEKVAMGNVCLWCNTKGKGFHTMDAVQKHMTDKGHCKLLYEGDALYEYSDYFDYSTSYPDHGEGRASGGDGSEDEEVDLPTLAEQNYQLVLPSGATIGHRSLIRYYRQNPPQRTRENKSAVNRLLMQYKALGWTGCTGTLALQKAKDVRYLQKMKSKHYVKLGVKANKFQPHFRQQVMF